MTKSLILRILSAATGLLAFTSSFVVFGVEGLYLFTTVAIMLLAYECGTLTLEKTRNFIFLLPLHLIFFLVFLKTPDLNLLFVFLILEICIWMWVKRFTQRPNEEVYTQHSSLYVFLFFSLIAPTFLLAHLNSTERPQAVFFLVFMIASFDTLSYFWGKGLGGKVFTKKLYPLSSPSKTIEGALFASITCTALTLVLDYRFPNFSIFYKIESLYLKAALCILIFIAALTGDLAESMLKRSKKAKDSGHLLPGHGGFFDRLDGFLFAGFISYMILQF